MLSIEKIEKINYILVSFFEIIFLQIMWCVLTLLGGVFLGIGPATYATVKYLNKRITYGENLPLIKTVWSYYKEIYVKSILISWLYIGVVSIIIVNLFYAKNWFIQFFNIVFLIGILISLTFIFQVFSDHHLEKISQVIKKTVLLSIGFLPYSIIIWLSCFMFYYFSINYFPIVACLLGIIFPILIITLFYKLIVLKINKKTFK